MAIDIVKCSDQGKETWRYTGELLHKQDGWVVVQAYFNYHDIEVGGMRLAYGDCCFETFFAQKWYNIFEIYDGRDFVLKGWYCNITRPAIIHEQEILYCDLALDLLVFPDGRQIIMDEQEFEALRLPEDTRRQAHAALSELQRFFADRPIKDN